MTAATCPHCGRPVPPDDAYCPSCGTLVHIPDQPGPGGAPVGGLPASAPAPPGATLSWRDLPDPFASSPEVFLQWDRTVGGFGGFQIVDAGGSRLAQFRREESGRGPIPTEFALVTANDSPVLVFRSSAGGNLRAIGAPWDLVAPWGLPVAQFGQSPGFAAHVWLRREGEVDITASAVLSSFLRGFPVVQGDLLVATVTFPRARPNEPDAPSGISLRFDAPYVVSASRPLLVAIAARLSLDAP